MKIGELAKVARCPVETIRYYEREGLLAPPQRTTGNFRVYGPAHVERLRFIRNCRALDMSQEEIRRLLALSDNPAEGCGAVNSLFDEHIAHVEERIRELSQLREQLASLRSCCQADARVDDCGILHGLAEMDSATRAGRHTHLG